MWFCRLASDESVCLGSCGFLLSVLKLVITLLIHCILPVFVGFFSSISLMNMKRLHFKRLDGFLGVLKSSLRGLILHQSFLYSIAEARKSSEDQVLFPEA